MIDCVKQRSSGGDSVARDKPNVSLRFAACKLFTTSKKRKRRAESNIGILSSIYSTIKKKVKYRETKSWILGIKYFLDNNNKKKRETEKKAKVAFQDKLLAVRL